MGIHFCFVLDLKHNRSFTLRGIFWVTDLSRSESHSVLFTFISLFFSSVTHSTCSDVSEQGKEKHSGGVLILVGTPLGVSLKFSLTNVENLKSHKLSLLSSSSHHVFPSWHLDVIYFLVAPASPSCSTRRVFAAGSPVASRHQRESRCCQPSKMTSDLLAGMLCRRKGSAASRTPPAGGFTLCLLPHELRQSAVSQGGTHPAALAATITCVITA